nr:glycosyltransferase [Chromobacterium sp. ASV5]
MRIALLSPLPPEQSGIADYALAWRDAMRAAGVEVATPFAGAPLTAEADALAARMQDVAWDDFDLVHAELGGGRCGEFLALEWLAHYRPGLPLTATAHDPERLIWRPAALPGPLALASRLPRRAYQAAALLADPWTLARERRLAARLSRLIALTETGAACLARRMRLPAGKVVCIAHGNHEVADVRLPPSQPLRLLYFGFLYRGKGIEDLLDALALLAAMEPDARRQVRLTLAGGVAPDVAFGSAGSYLDELRRRLAELRLGEDMVTWRLDVPADEIPALIQAHHVMVLPYRESRKLAWLGQMRGTSGGLSWAAACGRGVVSSDARAFAEEVSHGNGAVYPQGDSRALAGELARLLREPGRAIAFGRKAAELGARRAWPKTAERFQAAFAAVLREGEA